MYRQKFQGTGVALITPFRKDGSIDFKAFEKYLDYVIDDGADYLVALGTTSEYPTLSQDEKEAVINFIIDHNQKRLPLVLGIGGNSTNAVINKIQNQDFNNIDAILSVVPYYNKPSQKGLIQHFTSISSVSPVPIILYNVPSRTSKNMEADTIVYLAHNTDNIIGVKEASGDLMQCMKIINKKPESFLLISGEDALTMPIIAAGGNGVISVTANAYPKTFSEMVKAALENDTEKARKLHYELLHFSTLIFEDGNPSGIKAALQIKEITQSAVRAPLTTVNRSIYGKLDNEIKQMSFDR